MTNKFSWENFDYNFLREIVYNHKTLLENRPPAPVKEKERLAVYVEGISSEPTKNFAKKYRIVIEDMIFKNYPEVAKRVYEHITHSELEEGKNVWYELCTMATSAQLTETYAAMLYELGSGNEFLEYLSQYKYPVNIDLRKTTSREVPLYDFQEEAVEKLRKDFITDQLSAGLLVMPTGSGKTRTATYFLLKYMIPNGYQVIWLTHRHMLVDQAADAFVNNCSLITEANPKAKSFRITCVSGQHSSIREADKKDNVIIISVQSGFRNIDYLYPILGSKVIIVIDEAHHSVAKSYKKVVEAICHRKRGVKRLGLTATPVRGSDKESQLLYDFFFKHIVYDISMKELILNKVLSKPQFQKVDTEINFEPQIDVDEEKLIRRYGELPASVVQKVAESSKRNKLIVNHYLENKEKYGKTLIFALNVEHCVTLNDDLRKAGVKADYIYSGRDAKENERIISDFKNDKLDVLVNINILTEGSDVPTIKTVFLTRPTQSEGLLMQMIGRGMRGPKAQGTEVAYIVDFCDKWETFNKWLSPEWIMGEAGEMPEEKKRENRPVKTYPLQLLSDIYKGITHKGDGVLSLVEGAPIGWYECHTPSNGDTKILVFKGQEEGFASLGHFLNLWKTGIFNKTCQSLLNTHFTDNDFPPKLRDIDIFIRHWLHSKTIPEYHEFADVDKFDPMAMAENIVENNIIPADIPNHLRKHYEENQELIDSVHGTFSDYMAKVMDCMKALFEGIKPNRKIELLPMEEIPYKMEPVYNIQQLYMEVVDEMFGGSYSGIEFVEWTPKPCREYFGVYHSGGRIFINSLLNSPSVPREVVKFVIYHELLHRDNLYHNKEFRKNEHKYPGYVEWDRFLDNTFEKFDFDM